MQEADIPTSAIARFTKNRWSWFLMERFQNTTRHTEMLPRIPISVVMPSKIPMIITIPDSGILCRGNVVVKSTRRDSPSSRIDDLQILFTLEMLLILISKEDFCCNLYNSVLHSASAWQPRVKGSRICYDSLFVIKFHSVSEVQSFAAWASCRLFPPLAEEILVVYVH